MENKANPVSVPENKSIVDVLLSDGAMNFAKTRPTATYKIKRLAAIGGDSAVVKLQGLPYGRAAAIAEMDTVDTPSMILLEGLVEPKMTDSRLQDKFGGVTPLETLHAVFSPGEIHQLSARVERLSGFRTDTIVEVKND